MQRAKYVPLSSVSFSREREREKKQQPSARKSGNAGRRMRPSESPAVVVRPHHQHVEVLEPCQGYHVVVDARGETSQKPSVEVVLRSGPSTSLRGEIVMEQESVERIRTTRAGLVRCLKTDFRAAARPTPDAASEKRKRNEDSLIDRTIDLHRHITQVRSDISLDFDHDITAHSGPHHHQGGWLTSSYQGAGDSDSEDYSLLFHSPRGVAKTRAEVTPFSRPRPAAPNNYADSTRKYGL
jgi:hypothetical protein